jgi:L-ectoine synthase
MIIKQLKSIQNTGLDVNWGNGRSRRFLVQNDGVGFSLVDTIVNPNTESRLEYKKHLEACYCIEGEGEIECNGEIYPISEGSLYVLDKHEAHILRAYDNNMRLVCIFTPALRGDEVHQLKEEVYSSYE